MHHLPLLSLLLAVMPDDVRRRQALRYESFKGNMEFALWLSKNGLPTLRRNLRGCGFRYWIECSEGTVWCYGAGQIARERMGEIGSRLWCVIEAGQKARLLIHGERQQHQLMVISRREW